MFKGKEDQITAEHLKNGETCIVTGYGNSMTPKLKNGESVIMEPVTENTILEKNDIVLCKVNGHYYCHLISAIKNNSYQISNNHKRVNGWISKDNIFGKMISKI